MWVSTHDSTRSISTMFETTDQLSDAELEHYLSEIARIESESSADNDAIAYGSR